MQKPLVFISHITEEKEIAKALKCLVESTFLDMMDVFVSSDPTSIKLGHKWLDEITYALKACAVEIILSSPESVRQPWINFEGGSGWIRDIPVIPLCHSGMVPAKLPAPLSALQAATATEESGLKLIFPVLAEAIGCSLPDVNYTPFIETVQEFERESREFQQLVQKTPIVATDGLSQHELATLAEIADQATEELVPTSFIRNALGNAGYSGLAVSLALKMLARKDLVELSTESGWRDHEDYVVVKISDQGWNWLEANQDKFTLIAEPTKERSGGISLTPPDDDIPF